MESLVPVWPSRSDVTSYWGADGVQTFPSRLHVTLTHTQTGLPEQIAHTHTRTARVANHKMNNSAISNMHTYMPMTNLIEIFMGKMSTVYITIKVLFQPEFPIDHFLSLWFPLLHILSAPSLECFPSSGGKLWKLNENRTYWVELSAPQITLIVQNSIWKFWEIQIIWSKQKLDPLHCATCKFV